MIEGIKQIMDLKKMSAAQFSEAIEIQRSSLSHVLSGRNKPSLDFMLKIKSSFPEINLDWLLLGEGEVYSQGEIPFVLKSDISETEISQAEIEFATNNTEDEPKIPLTGKMKADTEDGQSAKPKPGKGRSPVKIVMFYDDNSFETFDSSQ